MAISAGPISCSCQQAANLILIGSTFKVACIGFGLPQVVKRQSCAWHAGSSLVGMYNTSGERYLYFASVALSTATILAKCVISSLRKTLQFKD